MANKLILHTDRISEEYQTRVDQLLNKIVPADVEVVQYNHNMEISWRDINKYTSATSVLDIAAIDPEKNIQGSDIYPHFTTYDLTSDGEWVYPLPVLHDSGSDTDGYIFGVNSLLRKLYIYAPECIDWICGCQKCPNLIEVVGNMDKVTDGWYGFGQASSLSKFRVRLSALRNAGYMFRDCILDKESVLIITDSIPSYASGNHSLFLGIHIDLQNDEEVLAAIDAATAKGWTVERRWNGTATASTFALRPAPPLPVYAKLDTYTDAEGNEWPILDWCHQVSSPDGKEPEELGYTLFESVEAAREYYGLPEEDENLKPD